MAFKVVIHHSRSIRVRSKLLEHAVYHPRGGRVFVALEQGHQLSRMRPQSRNIAVACPSMLRHVVLGWLQIGSGNGVLDPSRRDRDNMEAELRKQCPGPRNLVPLAINNKSCFVSIAQFISGQQRGHLEAILRELGVQQPNLRDIHQGHQKWEQTHQTKPLQLNLAVCQDIMKLIHPSAYRRWFNPC